MTKKLLLICTMIGMISCQEDQVYELPENAATLLTGDSTKTWKLARRFNNNVRMNMSPCFLNYRQSFSVDNIVEDNNGKIRIADRVLLAPGISRRV